MEAWIGDYGTESVNFTVGESKGHLLIIDNHGKKWGFALATNRRIYERPNRPVRRTS